MNVKYKYRPSNEQREVVRQEEEFFSGSAGNVEVTIVGDNVTITKDRGRVAGNTIILSKSTLVEIINKYLEVSRPVGPPSGR